MASCNVESTGIPPPSSRKCLSVRAFLHCGWVNMSTCEGSRQNLRSNHSRLAMRIFFLKASLKNLLLHLLGQPVQSVTNRHKAWAKALPSFCLADNDYVLASFTILGASLKNLMHVPWCDSICILLVYLWLCHFLPWCGVSCCCCFPSSTFVKHITSQFGDISIYMQVGD
jgi:hypothetical protein